MDYKTGKLYKIIREFDKSNGKYEINGIDLENAVFLYRKNGEAFIPVPYGNYQITKENNNTFLVIDNEINNVSVEFQIITVYEQKSSNYISQFPEIEIIQQKYNEVVSDLNVVIDYLNTTGIKADTLKMTQVLTPLEPLSVWYMTKEGKIDTLPIDDFNNKFQAIISKMESIADEKASEKVEFHLNRLQQSIQQLQNELENNKNEYIRNLSDKLSEALQTLETKKSVLENEINLIKTNTLQEFSNTSQGIITSINHKANTSLQEIEDKKNLSKAELESKMPEIYDRFNQVIGKEYGGILNTPGQKVSGKTYFDNNTKSLFLCKNNNLDISPSVENYIALDNKALLERLENFFKFKVINSDVIALKTVFEGSFRIEECKFVIVNIDTYSNSPNLLNLSSLTIPYLFLKDGGKYYFSDFSTAYEKAEISLIGNNLIIKSINKTVIYIGEIYTI